MMGPMIPLVMEHWSELWLPVVVMVVLIEMAVSTVLRSVRRGLMLDLMY